MATATQERSKQASKRSAPSSSSSQDKPWRPWELVNLSGLHNSLKLRSARRINDQLSVDIGADYCLQTRQAEPVGSLFYDVSSLLTGFGWLASTLLAC